MLRREGIGSRTCREVDETCVKGPNGREDETCVKGPNGRDASRVPSVTHSSGWSPTVELNQGPHPWDLDR
jgi:hypothetical protein